MRKSSKINQRGKGETMKRIEATILATTEKQFTQQVKDLAQMLGYRYYHPWLAIHSPRGFPDVCLIKGKRLIFAELKTDKGVVSPAQTEWLEALKATGKCEVYLWRASQLQEVLDILRREV